MQSRRNLERGKSMNLRRANSMSITGAVVTSACMMALFALPAGCQKSDTGPADQGTALLTEMKAWFDATAYEAMGYSSLTEALDDIYQDDGYTSMLYSDISAVLAKSAPSGTTIPSVLKECQDWFELIDYEMSGYDSLDEAIEDIFPDGGATLDLYRRIAAHNAGAK